MDTDELTRLMHQTTRGGGDPLDLDRIRTLGRRRRRAARIATGTVAVAVVAVLGGVWALLGPGGDATTVRAAAQDHEVTALSAYEKGVLARVPGSYEVDGTVVLTDRSPADAESFLPPGVHITGTPVPLGFHAMVGPGYLMSKKSDTAFQSNAPKGSQLVIDAGPVWLGCTTSKKFPDCSSIVIAKDAAGDFRFLYGLGSDSFLEPGAEMELFTDDDFSGHTWSQTLIGGFHGADTARVTVEMTDGSQVDAQLDVDRSSKGNTLFWAKLPRSIAWVRAYDAKGDLVAEHKIRDCKDPVDCEVR